MFTMLQRHAVQVLATAGVTQERIRETTGVPERTIRRIIKEPPVEGLTGSLGVQEAASEGCRST
jgi:predicted transcriptional regulator